METKAKPLADDEALAAAAGSALLTEYIEAQIAYRQECQRTLFEMGMQTGAIVRKAFKNRDLLIAALQRLLRELPDALPASPFLRSEIQGEAIDQARAALKQAEE